MKECDILQIVTDSVRTFIVDIFDKKIDDILISDLLLVETLTIDGKDFEGNRLVVSFQDLNFFKNLKYLEIVNCLINSSVINILSKMGYLENIIFRNCSFGKVNISINKLKINCLKIIDCRGFNGLLIKDLSNVKRMYLAGVKLENFNCFENIELESLDISYSFLRNIDGINNLKTNYLVIGHSQYNKFKDKIELLKCKVMVMADYRDGYYIEKWLN